MLAATTPQIPSIPGDMHTTVRRPESLVPWTAFSAVGTPAFAGFAVVLGIAIGILLGMGHALYAIALGLIPLLMFRPLELSLGLVVILMPFESVTAIWGPDKRSLVWFASAVVGLVLLGVGFVNRRIERPPRAAVWWTLFVCWGTTSILWAYDPQVAMQRLPTAWALLALYLAAVCFRITDRELRWIVVSTIAGGCAAALVSIYQFQQGMYWAGRSMRASMTVGETETNPNRFGLGLVLPLSLAVSSFLSSRSWRSKAWTLCTIGIIGLALFLTMSRTAFLGVIVVAFVFCRRMAVKRRIVAVIALLGVLTVSMPAMFFTRIGQASTTGGSGRFDIWIAGLMALKKYVFFGAGLDNFPVVYQNYAGYAPRFMGSMRDPHDIYLGIGVEGGIIALLLFFLAWNAQRKVMSSICGHRPSSLLIACEGTFWAMLICGVFENILWTKAFWFSWIFLAFALRTNNEGNDSRLASARMSVFQPATGSSEVAQTQTSSETETWFGNSRWS